MPTPSKRKNGVKTDLFDKRRQYSGKIIPDRTDPFKLFKEWFSLASKVVASEPNAMALSTVDKKGKPSSRFVLLKGFDERGFVFFTNSISRKGSELKDNPHVAALFYWHELHRQVRIEGKVSEISRREVETYFYSRPRDSQIAAMISAQSHTLKSRKELLTKFGQCLKSTRDPICPKTWTGYRIAPDQFEFWSGMPNRMHDRVRYTKNRSSWLKKRLWP
jgi:pyridoxamine 5'-phosphate oxidase